MLTTIPENAPFLKRLLGVEPQAFRPAIPHLVCSIYGLVSMHDVMSQSSLRKMTPRNGYASNDAHTNQLNMLLTVVPSLCMLDGTIVPI